MCAATGNDASGQLAWCSPFLVNNFFAIIHFIYWTYSMIKIYLHLVSLSLIPQQESPFQLITIIMKEIDNIEDDRIKQFKHTRTGNRAIPKN